jgi:1-acyl-sn-glycerol-3-phosphate acyltransferase
MRILGLVILVLGGVLAGICSGLLSLSAYNKLARLWHYGITRVVGVKCQFSGSRIAPGALVVSNHISWLDISVIGSRLPVVFLASSVIAGWPILGWMIARAGTLFIERGSGANDAVEEMAIKLGDGQSVQIFPEGKTTNGFSVIKFQPRLMQSAIKAGTSVQPVCIRYENKSGLRESRVRFDGEITFPSSLWRTVSGGPIKANVCIFDPIPATKSRAALGKTAENTIKQCVEAAVVEENSI